MTAHGGNPVSPVGPLLGVGGGTAAACLPAGKARLRRMGEAGLDARLGLTSDHLSERISEGAA
jgi:hypothetical protein